ncbi:hypothetical protein OBE_09106, partial [human gut metagenome]
MAISYDKKIMECVLRSVMSEGNVAQGKAIKSICKSPKPLFITGKGGSGKTTFLKRIIPALKNAVVVAPTGVALGRYSRFTTSGIKISAFSPGFAVGAGTPDVR